MKLRIRAERSTDQPAVFAVHKTTFPTDGEPRLVDTLRAHAAPVLSFVAETNDTIVGHVLFSPVIIGESNHTLVMGLAPMAVLPAHQRQGIGSALVEMGLEECRRLGVAAIVVLGHAAYYPRFGFAPASTVGLMCEFEVPEEAFMAMELAPRALTRLPGIVRYHPAFREF
jgi:putative acetyltransferase